ncbi:MAG: hypothetical protein ACAI34_12455 [Verrucomicrobium sp.]|nr:hypothetical protein [Verrucomicrobium sp.]
MDRLRTSPSYLPVRTFLICAVLALLLLQQSGTSLGDTFEFLVGVMPVGLNAESMLMVLAQKALPTFLLITLALVMGLSTALALAMLVSSAGAKVSKTTGWIGRSLVGVPPMMWAFALVLLIVNGWQLPVETLFPYDPPPGMEPLTVRVGRALWAWLVPALVLAMPVFGMALFSFTHRLSVLLKDPMLGPLKSRGLSRATIKYHHLVPELRVHLVRLARPAVAMLLAFTVPVERIFQFQGWGTFTAEAIRFQHPLQLAAVVYLAGIMLAVWYLVLDLGDKRSLPAAMDHAEDEEQTRSRVCLVAGALLAAGLLTLFFWAPADSPWLAAYHLMWRELGLCLAASLAAAILVVVSGLGISPSRRRRSFPRTGIIATLAAAPLLLLWMVLASAPGIEAAGWTLLVLFSAIPGAAAFHATYRESKFALIAESAFSIGRRHWGYWWDHVFLNALPSLMNWTLRNVATLLVWKSVFDYLSASRADAGLQPDSWGRMMAQHAGRFFDEPMQLMAPALLLSLWALSFRLLSRAFRTDTPQAQTSPFAS